MVKGETFTITHSLLIAEAVDRCGDEAAAIDKRGVAHGVDRDYRSVSEQATEVDFVANLGPWDWNNADRGGLMVHHTDGGFISNHAGNRCRRGIARKRNHVEAD